MGNSEQTEPVLRFQDFQVNLKTGELWKDGIRLKLQDQPFKVLTTLLKRPGQVVPREELHQLIWPQESFGDFDHAINLAVNKLRATLGDSADVPHLIETLPRRGYRFIAPVEALPAPKRNLVPLAIKHVVPRWVFRSFDAIRKHPGPAATITTLLILGIFLGYRAKHSSSSNSSSPVARSMVKLEPGYILEGIRLSPPWGLDQPTMTAMAISSSGRFIVYSAIRENPGPQDKPHLYLRRTDELEAKPIAGSEGGIGPFLSPDDRWVAFWADGKLMKVSINGGVPVTLSDQHYLAGSWGPDNKIVFAPGYTGVSTWSLRMAGTRSF
jgi:DNA-binding winged helix-turn-helix (wHTH) protein